MLSRPGPGLQPGGVLLMEVGRHQGASVTAPGSIESVCSARSGRSEWFQFHGTAGRMYKINTVLQAGGLDAASLYLHKIDENQTELAASRAWHCDYAPNEPTADQLRATCMLWACVESGDYAIRAAQTQGVGPYSVQITNDGSIASQAAAAAMAPAFEYTGLAESWTGDFQVTCQYTYCNYAKLAGTDGPHVLTGDGNAIVLALAAAAGETYNFAVTLADGAAATYIKLQLFADYPTPDVVADASNMVHEFMLGTWTTKAGDDFQ